VPELGLGNAEIKVVATAWNRHLLLFHNGDKYNARSWIMQLVLYIMAIATTALAIFSTTHPGLENNMRVKNIMLILPIVAALLTTIGTRLRQRQKYSQCKLSSFVIVSEIYKFRVRAIEYDQLALSAAVAAMEGGDDKKDEDEMPKPISSKERDKIARRMFVQRVKTFYSTCMATELATGTSISHTTRFGLDPARLLRETDDPDDELITRKLLQEHVAEKLYYIKNDEWVRGAEGYKEQRQRVSRRNRAALKAGLRRKAQGIYVSAASTVVGIAASFERKMLEQKAKAAAKLAAARGEVVEEEQQTKGKKYAPDEEAGVGQEQKVSKLQQLREHYKKLGSKQPAVVIAEEEKVERLDTTYQVVDEDDVVDGDSGGGGGGGGGPPGDSLVGPLTIDHYMQYRARPVCTYLERTAPYRAFYLQMLEIIVFIMNSFGAVLVGMGNEFVPWVSLTVAIAAVIRSFQDFANLEKQVEAYNTALREVHNMMNEWDGKTRTERRTRQVITAVVGTVENQMINVAMAICNAQATAGGDDGDGDGDDEKEE